MDIEALVFDVDGTLAETEDLHRGAFNDAFAAFELPWHWDPALYGQLLHVTGGKERILAFAARHRPEDLGAAQAHLAPLHAYKTDRYGTLLAEGALPLRPGIARLIAEARHAGLRLAIATTTTYDNVVALLEKAVPSLGPGVFDAILAGDVVARKKPWPDVYEMALDRLRLQARSCVAFEDSHNGFAAARAAGLPVVVTPSSYTRDDDFRGALSVVSDLGEPGKPHRHYAGRDWREGMVSVDSLCGRSATQKPS